MIREELREQAAEFTAKIAECRYVAERTNRPYEQFLCTQEAALFEELKTYLCSWIELLDLAGNDSAAEQARGRELEAKLDQQDWESWHRKRERIFALYKDWTNSRLVESLKESPQQSAEPGPLLPFPPDLVHDWNEDTIQRLFPVSRTRQVFARAILNTHKTQRNQRIELCIWIDQGWKLDLPQEWMTAENDRSFEIAYKNEGIRARIDKVIDKVLDTLKANKLITIN